jgi:long-chain acyl-CoA synthetase
VKLPVPYRQVEEPGEVLVPLFQLMYGLDEGDIYLSPAPLYHAAPMRWANVLHSLGATDVPCSQRRQAARYA